LRGTLVQPEPAGVIIDEIGVGDMSRLTHSSEQFVTTQ
jgi:hypothetical protein